MRPIAAEGSASTAPAIRAASRWAVLISAAAMDSPVPMPRVSTSTVWLRRTFTGTNRRQPPASGQLTSTVVLAVGCTCNAPPHFGRRSASATTASPSVPVARVDNAAARMLATGCQSAAVAHGAATASAMARKEAMRRMAPPVGKTWPRRVQGACHREGAEIFPGRALYTGPQVPPCPRRYSSHVP
ncbi:hypothetical protein D3C73_1114150 [compost metagenome]